MPWFRTGEQTTEADGLGTEKIARLGTASGPPLHLKVLTIQRMRQNTDERGPAPGEAASRGEGVQGIVGIQGQE